MSLDFVGKTSYHKKIEENYNEDLSNGKFIDRIMYDGITLEDFFVNIKANPRISFSNIKSADKKSAVPTLYLPMYKRFKELFGDKTPSQLSNMITENTRRIKKYGKMTFEQFKQLGHTVSDLFVNPDWHASMRFVDNIVDESGRRLPLTLKRLYNHFTGNLPSSAAERNVASRSPPKSVSSQVSENEQKAMTLVERHFGQQSDDMKRLIAKFIVSNSGKICQFSRLSSQMKSAIQMALDQEGSGSDTDVDS